MSTLLFVSAIVNLYHNLISGHLHSPVFFFNVCYPGFLSPQNFKIISNVNISILYKLDNIAAVQQLDLQQKHSLNLSKCCVCFSLGHQTTSELVGKNDALNLLPKYFAKKFLFIIIKFFFSIITLLNTKHLIVSLPCVFLIFSV